MSRYVVGSFAVVRTLGEPALDGLAVCGRVVVVTALEAKPANQPFIYVALPEYFSAALSLLN